MQQYINEIRNLISCPAKIYIQLYLSTISNFIIHCPTEIKNDRLKLGIAALKLRLGRLLPKNAGAEAIASEDAQWTYALFSGCILKNLDAEIVKNILPAVAEIWIQKNASLFSQWQDVINNQANKDNELEIIINHAFEKLNHSNNPCCHYS